MRKTSFISNFLPPLFSQGIPKPAKIQPRILGKGQAANMNLCKMEAAKVYQQATRVYQKCVAELLNARIQIGQPVLQIATTIDVDVVINVVE